LVLKPVPRAPFKGEALAIPGKIEVEDFDINGVGQGNTTYNESDSENHGDSDYRPGTGVDLYKKASGIIVGYNQAGEWLEYTVKVASTGTYTMNASVASANSTSSFKLSMDGKDITEEIAVPAATAGEDNYDEYNTVEAKVSLTEGEHILRFTVTGDWMDIDWIKFCAGESCETTGLRTALPVVRSDASAPRLIKKGNTLFIDKNGKRFDLTGHRIK
jgi:alpha-galactosidase